MFSNGRMAHGVGCSAHATCINEGVFQVKATWHRAAGTLKNDPDDRTGTIGIYWNYD